MLCDFVLLPSTVNAKPTLSLYIPASRWSKSIKKYWVTTMGWPEYCLSSVRARGVLWFQVLTWAVTCLQQWLQKPRDTFSHQRVTALTHGNLCSLDLSSWAGCYLSWIVCKDLILNGKRRFGFPQAMVWERVLFHMAISKPSLRWLALRTQITNF